MTIDMNELPRTVGDCLLFARDSFKEAGLGDGIREARILLCGLIGLPVIKVVSYPEIHLNDEQLLLIRMAISRRLEHEPIHRILGWREFYHIRLVLLPEIFDPRPETEFLVDAILPHLRRIIAKKGQASILDLGTGSGSICLALLKECSQSEGIGIDISSKALEVARKNAVNNSVSDRFSTIQSNWFSMVEGCFDVIVSNPPYIASTVIDDLEPEVKNFDPRIALDGGSDGLFHYRTIVSSIHQHLDKDGICGVEIGYNQKSDIVRIFEEKKLSLLESVKDYRKQDRALIFIPDMFVNGDNFRL